MNSKVSEISSAVAECTSSGTSFTRNTPKIIDTLACEDQAIHDQFLASVLETLTSETSTPAIKFYVALLLLKVSEKNNRSLMRRLAKTPSLLDKIFKDCQHDYKKPCDQKGRRYFSKNPTDQESIIGNNYVNLIVECFKYWSEAYQCGDEKTSLKIYEVIMKNLKERMEFPELIAYVGLREIPDNFHLIPYKYLVFAAKDATPENYAEEVKAWFALKNQEIPKVGARTFAGDLVDDQSEVENNKRLAPEELGTPAPKAHNNFAKLPEGIMSPKMSAGKGFSFPIPTETADEKELNEMRNQLKKLTQENLILKETLTKIVKARQAEVDELKDILASPIRHIISRPTLNLYKRQMPVGSSNMFYLFTYAMEKSMDSDKVAAMRKLVSYYILVNKDYARSELKKKDLEDYCEKIEHSNVSGGEFEMKTLARHYRVEVYIIEKEKIKSSLRFVNQGEFKQRIYVIYDKKAAHFDLIVRGEDSNKDPNKDTTSFESSDEAVREGVIKIFFEQDF